LTKGNLATSAHPAPNKTLPTSDTGKGHGKQKFPQELLTLRLFKCRMWLWLVVPGLHDAEPTKLVAQNPSDKSDFHAFDEEPRGMELAATKTKSACADCN
jgi:hypothetical protein